MSHSLARISLTFVLLSALTVLAGRGFTDAEVSRAVDGTPVAKFDFAPTEPREGDIIQFIDLSYDPNGTIVSWDWNINGETTTTQNPLFLFEDQGEYSASLTVTDNDGATNTVTSGGNDLYGDPVPALDVVNAPPLVNALDVETLAGQPAVLRGRLIDPGVPDVHAAEWQIAGEPVADVEEEHDPLLSTGLVTGSLPVSEPVSGYMAVSDGEGGNASDFFIVNTVPDDEAARTRHEPNNLPADGSALSADASYISFLQEQGDIDIFEIQQPDNQPIRAGSEILTTLSDSPADYDIAIIAESPAGTSEAGFSKIGLSTLGYSKIGFSKIGFSQIGYSKIGFSKIGYSQIGFSKIGLSTFGTSGASWADIGFSKIGFSKIGYSKIGNEVTALDVTLDDLGLNGLPGGELNVADFSAARGLSDETAWARSTEGGTRFYVAVFGANEAYSSEHPYSLSIEVLEPPEVEFDLGAACLGDTLVTTGATSETTVLHDYDDITTGGNDAANALFVVQEQRFRAVYGMDQAAWDAFLADIVAVAQHPSVRGDVISLPSTIYDNWDQNPCSVDAANSVVTQIRDIIQAPPYDAVEHLQLLGNDQMLPFHRIQDHAIIGNEKDYLLDSMLTPGSPLYIAILQGYMLSDHYVADSVLDPWQGGQFPVPDKAVGRLVETPEEISAAAQAFLDSNGILAPSTGFVSGYDFFDDGSQVIADNLATGLSDVDSALIDGKDTLIADLWTAEHMRCRLLDDGANSECRAPDVGSPNAHFTHYAGLSAQGFETGDFGDALMADDVASAGGGIPVLEGSIVFTMGCHAGFNAPDGLTAAPQDGFDPSLDFAQAAARQKAIWVASTGFGIGDDEGIAGTEEIMGNFAGNLMNSGLTAGEAHAKTLRDYILAQNPLSVYDVKSAVQTTYYGLTMYAVTPQTAVSPLRTLSPVVTVENLAYSFSLTTVDTTAAITSVTSNHTLNENLTLHGTWFDLDGDGQATMGRAVQPRGVFDLDARHPHAAEPPPVSGLIVMGGSYTDLTNYDPLISRRKFEWEKGVTEPQECLTGFTPSQPIAINSLRGVNSVDQALVVIPGQFRCTSSEADPVTGVERLWTSMTVDVRRCAATDGRGPVIERVDIRAVSGASEVTVKASDDSGLARIVALRIAGGNIASYPLMLAGQTSGEFVISVPTSGLPQEEIYLQVEDTECNTSVHTAKAGYLSAISVNAGADRQFAPGPTDFPATITGFTSLANDITFTWDFGDGASMVGVLSPNGLSTVPVTIDGLGNATFTVSHTYAAAPIPPKATVRIDEGQGGTGTDDVVFSVACDPAGDSVRPAGDVTGCVMSNVGDDVTIKVTTVAPIDPKFSYRVFVTSPVNTQMKYDAGRVTGGPKGLTVTVTGNQLTFKFKASKAGIAPGSVIQWYVEVQSGIPGSKGAGKLDRAPNTGTLSYTLQ